MNIHPDIAMLRSDIASQHRIAKRMRQAQRDWSDNPAVREVADDLKRYAEGAGVSRCSALSGVLTDLEKARGFADVFTNTLLSGLSEEALGEVPFRYRASPGFSSVQLLQSGGTAINLTAYELRNNAPQDKPQSVLFADCDSIEIVLSGSGAANVYTLDEQQGTTARIALEQSKLNAGNRICLSGMRQSRQITLVEGMMVILQLSKVPERPASSREFRLSDGVCLQSASGDKAASQRLMALAVLGSLDVGSDSKHAALNRSALDQTEDVEVRWEAIRQTLALDARHGLNLLNTCIGNESDPLANPARQLRDQLFETERV